MLKNTNSLTVTTAQIEITKKGLFIFQLKGKITEFNRRNQESFHQRP